MQLPLSFDIDYKILPPLRRTHVNVIHLESISLQSCAQLAYKLLLARCLSIYIPSRQKSDLRILSEVSRSGQCNKARMLKTAFTTHEITVLYQKVSVII